MIKERRTLVAGPLTLIQGGTGIIGRTPIFARRPGGEGDTYWGIASIVIDFHGLVETAGLERARASLQLSLRGLDGTGSDGPVFWGDLDAFRSNPVVMHVPLPSGGWQLAGLPKTGWPVFRPWREPVLLTRVPVIPPPPSNARAI